MPRTPRTTTASTRGKRSSTAQSIVSQISQLVAANEQLQRENRELRAANERLRGDLSEIGTALGRLTGSPRRGRGRGGFEPAPEPAPRRRRKPSPILRCWSGDVKASSRHELRGPRSWLGHELRARRRQQIASERFSIGSRLSTPPMLELLGVKRCSATRMSRLQGAVRQDLTGPCERSTGWVTTLRGERTHAIKRSFQHHTNARG